MPVDIDAGSKDVDMIHADEEQTEAEMLKEALALSSYENHAPKGKLRVTQKTEIQRPERFTPDDRSESFII
jgi:hypothetical protein